MTGLRIRVYECIKGVTKVSGLQKEDLANGSKIGVLPAAVSLLLAEDRIEFSVVLEGKRPQKNGPPEILWLGYHFFGQFSNLQRCFRKKHSDAETIFSILHKNLTTKFNDPFTSPMLLIDNSAKGFWQISSTEAPHEVLGFIPLHRTDMFHSLKSYPIIFFEGEKAQAIVGSDVDRNNLYHLNNELDAAYTQTLRKLSALFKNQKWCSVVLPAISGSENANNNSGENSNDENRFPDINAGQKFDLRSLSHWLARDESPLTLVYGLSLWRKGIARDFDLATLGASASGRSHLVNFLHTFSLSPHYNENSDLSDLDLTSCKTALDKLFDDLKEMKSMVSHGTAIYNPFFEKSRVAERGNLPNPSLVIESHSLKLHNAPPKPSSYKFPPVLLDPPSTSTNDSSFLNEDQSPKKQQQKQQTQQQQQQQQQQHQQQQQQQQQPQPTSPLPKPFLSLSSETSSSLSPRTGSPRALSSSSSLSSSPSPMSPNHQQQLMNLLQQRKNSLRQQQNNTPPPLSSPSPIPLSSSPVPLSSPSPLHKPSPIHPQSSLSSSIPPRNEEASQVLMDFIKKDNNNNPSLHGLLTPARLQSTSKPQQGWSDPGIVHSGKPLDQSREASSDIDMSRLAVALVNVLTNPNYNFRIM